MDDAHYVLWGSAGHAKVLRDLIALRNGVVVATFDNDGHAAALAGIPLYIGMAGFGRWLRECRDPAEHHGLVAIGGARGRDRLELHRAMRAAGLRTPALSHPMSALAATARVGEGSQLLAHSLVASDAVVGEACIVNHGASVDHECRLGDGVHIAPGATLCGLVTVGDFAFVGAGAVVLPRVTLGADCVIGAGAVVTRDVPPGAVVAGAPARPIKKEGRS